MFAPFAVLRQRDFALLWSAGVISGIGDGALFVALPIYVYQVTHSSLATSGMFLAELAPALLLGSLAGVFVDRWDRKRTMVVTNLILAVTLLPLLAVHSRSTIGVVYLVAAAQAITSQFFNPALGAFLPRVVGEERLASANSLVALTQNLIRLIGPSIGGVLAAAAGLGGVVLLDAATFLLAASLSALIAVSGTPARAEAVGAAVRVWQKLWREWLQGLALVRRQRLIAVIIGALALGSLGEGVFSVMFVIWVKKVLGGGPEQLGWFLSAQGIGGLAGGFVIARISQALPPRILGGVGSIIFALIDLALFLYPLFVGGIVPGIILIVVVGVPAVAAGVSLTTLVQTGTPDEYRGRIFGTMGTTSALFRLAGTLIAGVLGGIVGPIALLAVMQSGSYLLVGFAVLLLLPSRSPAPV